jgi:sugar phosphate isomerase/epimerase
LHDHSVRLSDSRETVDEHLAIGAGTIDFRRVLGALRRIDFAGPLGGPLIVELVDVRKKLASLRRLRALLGTLPG